MSTPARRYSRYIPLQLGSCRLRVCSTSVQAPQPRWEPCCSQGTHHRWSTRSRPDQRGPLRNLRMQQGRVRPTAFDPPAPKILATYRDGSLQEMNKHWGTTLATWPAVGFGENPPWLADRRDDPAVPRAPSPGLLYFSTPGPVGRVGDAPTCKGKATARSLAVENDLAAYLETCDGHQTEFAQSS